MQWFKRGKLQDLERNAVGLASVNVTMALSDIVFGGNYTGVRDNKMLMAVLARQMAFELQNCNESQCWERPFAGVGHN